MTNPEVEIRSVSPEIEEIFGGGDWTGLGARAGLDVSSFAGVEDGSCCSCLARCMLSLHAGVSDLAALGDSDGLFRALSSQLDFVGLQRRGSIVFEGLRDSNSSEGGGVLGRFCGNVLAA